MGLRNHNLGTIHGTIWDQGITIWDKWTHTMGLGDHKKGSIQRQYGIEESQ